MRLTTPSLLLLPNLALAISLDSSSHTTSTHLQETSLSSNDSPAQPIHLSLQPSSTPSPSLEDLQHLDLREIVDAPAAAQATDASQVSPVTTYQMYEGATQVAIVYTQTFASVPDQWPGPSSGSIGLGTVQGTVGVTKTNNDKRDATPTPAADVADQEEAEADKMKREASANAANTVAASKAGAGSVLALAIAIAVMIIF